MKKLFCAVVLALPFLATPGEAKASWFGSWEIEGGAKVWLRVRQSSDCWGGGAGGFAGGPGGAPQAGPWYLYWPMEAHFQVPAPGAVPYFSPMTLPPQFGGPSLPPPVPAYWRGR